MPSIHHCIMRRRASSPLKFCPTLTVLLHRLCPGILHCADCAVSTPRFQTSDKAKCPASPQSTCHRRRSNGTDGPATGGSATGGLPQPHPPAAAPGGSASAAGPNRGLTRRALAASALTELTTSFSAPPSWFSMFKPLSSSAAQRAQYRSPSSSNFNVSNRHKQQCICVAPRRNGIAEAASTQRLTTAKVWNYSLQETSANTICPHDGGEVMVKYRDPHSPPVQKQTTHWERANTHLGNKHDKNWKQGANAHLSEMFGILVIMQ
jgi:hypothetical protein